MLHTPWILKRGGLESSGWRLISLIGKTKRIAFFFLLAKLNISKFSDFLEKSDFFICWRFFICSDFLQFLTFTKILGFFIDFFDFFLCSRIFLDLFFFYFWDFLIFLGFFLDFFLRFLDFNFIFSKSYWGYHWTPIMA